MADASRSVADQMRISKWPASRSSLAMAGAMPAAIPAGNLNAENDNERREIPVPLIGLNNFSRSASLRAYDPEIARINGWSLSVKPTELTLLRVRTAVVPTVGS